MEKYAIRINRKKSLGLLIFFLILFESFFIYAQEQSSSSTETPVVEEEEEEYDYNKDYMAPLKDWGSFGRRPSWQYVQSLKFKKMNEYFFTQEDSSFVVDIKGVSPEDVTVFVNDVPRNVSFVSARKEIFSQPGENPLDNTNRGTHLVISFRFSKPGVYQILPIDVRVMGMYNRISLEPALVYENPNTVQPELYLQFENPEFNASEKNISVKVGDHIGFTMFIRYALQLINFNWNIPEDSLFEDVHRFEITEGNPRGSEFSPEAVPVAKFDWQPLKAGVFELPSVHITATTYGGKKVDVPFPKYKVIVSEANGELSFSRHKENVFGYAFTSPAPEKEILPEEKNPSVDITRLLELHKNELHSMPFFSSAYEERRRAQEKAGITPSPRLITIPLTVLGLSLFFVFFILTIVLFFLRKKIKRRAIFVLAVAFTIAFASFSVYLLINVNKKYALFNGGKVNPIPESNVQTSVSVQRGSVVQIERNAGGWVYIRYHDTRGWVPKTSVFIIE